eukprot:GCRY01002503.1.p1 GENE.GCRY01002503.1~~GCRY01002503.1.p1  ORF type:complete len:212 (+),score=24.04 GCRY01002503.1:84-719(+)
MIKVVVSPVRRATVRCISHLQLAIEKKGVFGDPSFGIFFKNLQLESEFISCWHDVDLQEKDYPEDIFNFVCEIPCGCRSKMELAKDASHNPIMHDLSNGQPRIIQYSTSHRFHYGFFPQTFEDAKRFWPEFNSYGDDDPLDVVEVARETAEMGSVYPVRVLGGLPVIDQGEVDWKIITTRAPLAAAGIAGVSPKLSSSAPALRLVNEFHSK